MPDNIFTQNVDLHSQQRVDDGIHTVKSAMIYPFVDLKNS